MIRSPLLLGTASERDAATRIGVVRVTVGALPLLAPPVARAVFGVPTRDDTPAFRTVARLFGVRNIALGLWALSVRDSDTQVRGRCYQLNAAVDAVDVVALLWPALCRQGLLRFVLTTTPLGVSATLAWLELLQRARRASISPSAPSSR